VRVHDADAGKGALDRASRIADTDGLLTDSSGLILTVLHADCAPIFFADGTHRAIGLAHAGWRGVLAGLAGKMVHRMTTEFGSDPAHIQVQIGPMISRDAYDVSGELGVEFTARFGFDVAHITEGRVQLDLFAALVIDLLQSGIAARHLPARPPCTASHAEFSSFRRDGAPARSMVSWFMIRPTR
jgi:YfiH family protein